MFGNNFYYSIAVSKTGSVKTTGGSVTMKSSTRGGASGQKTSSVPGTKNNVWNNFSVLQRLI